MQEKQCAAIRAHIAVYIDDRRRAGWDKDRIAASLGFAYSTLHKRRDRPENMTLAELQRISNTLNITIPTLIGVMGDEKL